MRSMARGFIFSATMLLVLSQNVASQENQEELKAELGELQAKMDRAMVDGEVEVVLAFYADDAIVLPNNAPKIVGKVELRKKMQEHRKSGVSFGSFMGTTDRAWECGGMVYAVGSYAMSANVPGMPRPVGDKGKSFAVFRRGVNGKLQIVYDMWSADIEYGK